MQKSSFFNSVKGDRKYKAEEFAEFFASFIGNGIFANPSNTLKVLEDSGMNITVKAGKAWINGYYYNNTTDYQLTVPRADAVLKRIDRIVVRWSLSERKIILFIKKGTPSTNPLPPQLQRDADIYELALADIALEAGTVSIKNNMITDCRHNTSLCGIVAHVVQELDLTEFYEECSRNMMQQVDEWEKQTKDQQENWLQQMQEQKLTVENLQKEYSTWKATIESWKNITLTDLGQAVSFVFDNQFAHPGTIREMIEDNNSITSVMKFEQTGRVLAEQATVFKTVNDVEVIETTQKVYTTDDKIFRNVKITTTFNENKITSKAVNL